MPDDLLNLNLGQVQAVIDGYSERIVDQTCLTVWTGYYAAYFFSKHPKKPTEIIKQLIAKNAHESSQERNSTTLTSIEEEIEQFAKRDLYRFDVTGGNSIGNA